jgi:hypothetical protein
MKLQVLTRGDVSEPARIPLGHVSQCVELLGVAQALRELDANHLHVRLPLPVGAAQQAERAPLIRAELAALERFELGDELVNLRRIRKRGPRASKRLGVVHCCHDDCSVTPATRRELSKLQLA